MYVTSDEVNFIRDLEIAGKIGTLKKYRRTVRMRVWHGKELHVDQGVVERELCRILGREANVTQTYNQFMDQQIENWFGQSASIQRAISRRALGEL